MRRYLFSILLALASAILLIWSLALADDQPAEGVADESGQADSAPDDAAPENPAPKDEASPAKPAKPLPKSREEQTAEAGIAAMFDPAMSRTLQAAWDSKSRQPSFTAGDNVTILSLPASCGVYVASVDSIQGGAEGAEDPTVEGALFAQGNFKGDTPLTLSFEPGDYVIGIRAQKRVYGFDGDCVCKSTRDVITGGMGQAYHLYMLRKVAGEYQCLLANFSSPNSKPDELGAEAGLHDTFSFNEDALIEQLAQSSNAPEEQRERIAEALNRFGVAFYSNGGDPMLIKVFIKGDAYELREWMVERQ